MKIIQEGQINETSKDWWHGKRLTCLSCRAVFELEASDSVTAYTECQFGGRRTVAVKCPTCKATAMHREGGTFQWNSPVWQVPNPPPLTITSTDTGAS